MLDFVDDTDKSKLKPDQVRSYSDTMATAVRSFPDLKVRSVNFASVNEAPRCGELRWCLISQCAVWPLLVVIAFPGRDARRSRGFEVEKIIS